MGHYFIPDKLKKGYDWEIGVLDGEIVWMSQEGRDEPLVGYTLKHGTIT